MYRQAFNVLTELSDTKQFSSQVTILTGTTAAENTVVRTVETGFALCCTARASPLCLAKLFHKTPHLRVSCGEPLGWYDGALVNSAPPTAWCSPGQLCRRYTRCKLSRPRADEQREAVVRVHSNRIEYEEVPSVTSGSACDWIATTITLSSSADPSLLATSLDTAMMELCFLMHGDPSAVDVDYAAKVIRTKWTNVQRLVFARAHTFESSAVTRVLTLVSTVRKELKLDLNIAIFFFWAPGPMQLPRLGYEDLVKLTTTWCGINAAVRSIVDVGALQSQYNSGRCQFIAPPFKVVQSSGYDISLTRPAVQLQPSQSSKKRVRPPPVQWKYTPVVGRATEFSQSRKSIRLKKTLLWQHNFGQITRRNRDAFGALVTEEFRIYCDEQKTTAAPRIRSGPMELERLGVDYIVPTIWQQGDRVEWVGPSFVRRSGDRWHIPWKTRGVIVRVTPPCTPTARDGKLLVTFDGITLFTIDCMTVWLPVAPDTWASMWCLPLRHCQEQ